MRNASTCACRHRAAITVDGWRPSSTQFRAAMSNNGEGWRRSYNRGELQASPLQAATADVVVSCVAATMRTAGEGWKRRQGRAARVGSGDGDGRRGIGGAARRGPSEGIESRKKKLGTSFFCSRSNRARLASNGQGWTGRNCSAGAPAPSIALDFLRQNRDYR